MAVPAGTSTSRYLERRPTAATVAPSSARTASGTGQRRRGSCTSSRVTA